MQGGVGAKRRGSFRLCIFCIRIFFRVFRVFRGSFLSYFVFVSFCGSNLPVFAFEYFARRNYFTSNLKASIYLTLSVMKFLGPIVPFK